MCERQISVWKCGEDLDHSFLLGLKALFSRLNGNTSSIYLEQLGYRRKETAYNWVKL
jgi:hypothetical protein